MSNETQPQNAQSDLHRAWRQTAADTEKHALAGKQLHLVEDELIQIANGFMLTGNEKMAQALCRLSEKVRLAQALYTEVRLHSFHALTAEPRVNFPEYVGDCLGRHNS